MSVSALAGLLDSHGAEASVPESILPALAGTSGNGIETSATQLAREVMQVMKWTKIKLISAITVVAACLVGLVAVQVSGTETRATSGPHDTTIRSEHSEKEHLAALRGKASATRQGIQPSTPAPAEKEIVRAPVPRKRDAAPETQKETVAAVGPKVQPSISESPTILAMKEGIEGSSSMEQDTTPKTSEETFAATEQEVRPDPPGPATSPPPSDAAAKVEANQKRTSISHPYSVYLGSYGTLERVEKAVSKYKENGLSSLYCQEEDL